MISKPGYTPPDHLAKYEETLRQRREADAKRRAAGFAGAAAERRALENVQARMDADREAEKRARNARMDAERDARFDAERERKAAEAARSAELVKRPLVFSR